MLKLKLQYFGHLMRRVDSLEKTRMLGGIGGRRVEVGIKYIGFIHSIATGPRERMAIYFSADAYTAVECDYGIRPNGC